MLQIEKEHKYSTLMSSKKKDLVKQIMYLEHNNNVLHNTINQQADNFKVLQRGIYHKLDRKSFTLDYGHNQTRAVRLVDIEGELLQEASKDAVK